MRVVINNPSSHNTMHGWQSTDVMVLAVVVTTAIAAKFFGCSAGAKLTGLNWRESAAVGVLVCVCVCSCVYVCIPLLSEPWCVHV